MKYLIALMIAGGILGGAYWKYTSLEKAVASEKDKVTQLQSIIESRDIELESYRKANETLTEQVKGKDDAQKLNAALSARVNSLRKSIDNLTTKSSTSPETCNRSLAVTGELFAECGERYKDVAGKAELLRQDAIALDKDSDMLRGLISNLRPLDGYK